jgi:hypothetical protein
LSEQLLKELIQIAHELLLLVENLGPVDSSTVGWGDEGTPTPVPD